MQYMQKPAENPGETEEFIFYIHLVGGNFSHKTAADIRSYIVVKVPNRLLYKMVF